MSSLKSLLGAGGGVQINQDIFLHSTATTVTEGDQVFLRSGYVSDDISTYSAATYGLVPVNQRSRSQQHIRDVHASSDGTKLFIAHTGMREVYQWTLNTAWDLSTFASSIAFSVYSQVNDFEGLSFSSDGTKMYALDDTSNSVFQYTLTTAWDLSTASYASKSFSVNSQDTYPSGVGFSSDGTKMYILGRSNSKVFQYSLSTAWDVSTASYASKSFSVNSGAYGLHFSSDGTKMHTSQLSTNKISRYTLSTAWDVSTASYSDLSIDLSAQASSLQGITFSSDGTKLYAAQGGYPNQSLQQYDILTAVGLPTEHTRGNATQYVRVK